MVEQRTENPRVEGSSPPPTTMNFHPFCLFRAGFLFEDYDTSHNNEQEKANLVSSFNQVLQ